MVEEEEDIKDLLEVDLQETLQYSAFSSSRGGDGGIGGGSIGGG